MSPTRKLAAKRTYHHGDLEAALLQAALDIIDRSGVEALSIREVGNAVGVSRTALYRHYESKNALLAQVAALGFRKLLSALEASLPQPGQDVADPLEEMASAYVRFAVANPSQYKVMFGTTIEDRGHFPDLAAAGNAAFNALADGIARQQAAKQVVDADPVRLAQIIWAEVHGLAMLGIHGQLAHRHVKAAAVDDLVRFAIRQMRTGFGL